MRRLTITQRIAAGIALVAVGLAALLVLLVLTIGAYRSAERDVAREQRGMAAANRAEKLVIDLETAVRGVAVTGQERFREPYDRAVERLPQILRVLAQNTDDGQRIAALEIAAEVGAYQQEYAVPVLSASLGGDAATARARIRSGEGKQRSDALRRQFTSLVADQQRTIDERTAEADRAGNRAIVLAVGGSAILLVFVVLIGVEMIRRVLRPLGHVADVADELAAGDLGARVGIEGDDEMAVLGQRFDAMATALEDSHDELETQNTELELQAAELEHQSQELELANEELLSQREELQEANLRLADESARSRLIAEFGEQLVATSGVEPIARLVLRTLADATGADIGTIHAGADLRPVAARGLRLAELERLEPGVGLGGRALQEQRSVIADEPGTVVSGLGGPITIATQIHVPLPHVSGPVGVLALGWTGDEALDGQTADLVAQLSRDAAIALGEADQTERLEELARLNQTILDATRDGIALVAADGRLAFANRAMRAHADRYLPQPVEDLREHLDELVQRFTDPDACRRILRVISDPDDDTDTYDELQYVADGAIAAWMTSPVYTRDGTRLGRLLAVRDITAERQSSQAKQAFVANVSHELRTPLATIRTLAEVLAVRHPDDGPDAKTAQALRSEADRLAAIVNDLLELQVLDRARFRLDPQRMDLRDVVAERSEQQRGRAAGREVVVVLPDEPLVVEADAGRIAQALDNLLDNAVKYSPPDSPIEVAATPVEGRARVEVADRGVGIPGSELDAVFERFHRVSHENVPSGTGLGLALVRELVELHGGTTGVQSAEGVGSRFWFELPLAADPSANGG